LLLEKQSCYYDGRDSYLISTYNQLPVKGAKMERMMRISAIVIVGMLATSGLYGSLDSYTYKALSKDHKYLQGGVLEEISFYAPDGPDSNKHSARKGTLLRRKDAGATVLVCHGYMCDKHDAALFRTVFPDYNVMTFDFRAHGESRDNHQLCTFGRDESYDVIAAVNYIKNDPELSKMPLIAYGFSMGAVAAILAQSKTNKLFDAMVLDCPYDKSENVLRKALHDVRFTLLGYEFSLPAKELLGDYAFNPYVQGVLKAVLRSVSKLDPTATNTQIYPVNPSDAIKQVDVPCFFIHCRNDEKIPVKAICNVYENAKGFKRLWVTDGRRHFDSYFYNPEAYVYKVNRFITKVLNGTIADKQAMKVTGLEYKTSGGSVKV